MISQYNRFFSRSRSLYKPGYSPQLEFGTGSLAGTSRFVWSFQSRMIGPSFLMDHTLFVQLDLQSGRNKLRQAKKKTSSTDNYRSLRPPFVLLKDPFDWKTFLLEWNFEVFIKKQMVKNLKVHTELFFFVSSVIYGGIIWSGHFFFVFLMMFSYWFYKLLNWVFWDLKLLKLSENKISNELSGLLPTVIHVELHKTIIIQDNFLHSFFSF